MAKKVFKEIKIPVDYFTREMLAYPNGRSTAYENVETGERVVHGLYKPTKYNDEDETYDERLTTYTDTQEKIVNGEYREVDQILWIDNHIFEATMTIESSSRGRSSAKFILTDNTNNRYEMFLSSALNMMQGGIVNKGEIRGKWCYVKRGANYGIEFVESN